MKQFVVSVRDAALGAFGRPFFVPSEGVARRSFQDEVNRAADDNQMYKHPEDFELFVLASFDEETGRFGIIDGAPRSLCTGKSVKIGE